MQLNFEVSMVLAILLVSIRVGAVFLLTPLFSVGNIPVRIRVYFTLGLSLIFVLLLGKYQQLSTFSVDHLFGMAVYEAFLGLTLAFGVFTAFAVFSFGGRILDYQMGFGVASLIDPVTHNQEPLMGTLLNMMAVIIFFIIDGHHMLIKGIAYSLEMFPPGSMLSEFSPVEVIAQFGSIFLFGLALVAPAVFVLFLIDVAMAVAARTMPQVNMFIIGIPIKIFVGLTVFAASIGYIAPLLRKVYMSIFIYWQNVLV